MIKIVVEELKKNIAEYPFKKINDIIKELSLDTNSLTVLCDIAEILIQDKRKNVAALGNRLNNKVNKFQAELDRVKGMYIFDKSFGDYNIIAGVDEVGRGPLAGPIVSCAVVLNLNDLDDIILEINDSKLLSEQKREELSEIIKEKAISYSISELDNKQIDSKGIAYCNNQIFINACNGLSVKPDLVLSDGYLIKNFNIDNKHVVKGDQKSASIACASILAKVYRDNLMKEYGKKYPYYEFEKNSGYGTKSHVDSIKAYGVTPIHRRSFLNNILGL